jgi:hypothetical protein
VETLLLYDPLEETEALDAADLVRREEDHAHAVAAPAAQPHPGSVRDLVQEAVGYLDGQTGAIAGVLLGAGGATMLEIDEDGQGVANDAMRGPAGDVHDEAEAARVVLEGRVIQTLGSRTASLPHLGFHPRFDFLRPSGRVGADRSPCSVRRSPLSVAEPRVSPRGVPWSRLRRLRMGTIRQLRCPAHGCEALGP